MAKKTLIEQARAMLKGELALGKAKKSVDSIGQSPFKKFTSLRSFNETTAALARIGAALGVERLKNIDSAKAHEYLINRINDERSHNKIMHAEFSNRYVSQKTIDAERKALSVLLKQDIPRIQTPHVSVKKARAYTNEQVAAIANCQSEKNALSTRIAHHAGLRASELLTLQRKDELKITASRSWNKDRFAGESGVRYVVKGKGGLIREVILSNDLVKELEANRRVEPIVVKDRGINHTSYYDISGGNKFSSSFSNASQQALGFSNGAHGLRHQYVQSRMIVLQTLGHTEKSAKVIVSQEVGHFRASVTSVYLK